MVDQNQEPSLEEEQQLQLQHPMDPTNTYTPCCSCYCFGSNTSMKRRSPSSSATPTEKRACKKLFLDQQQDLTLNGVSTMSFPFTHGTFPNTVSRASCGLSPLPHSVKGVVRDPTNWRDKGVVSTKEEASNSMRLRRMKGCLKEMRKWWDEVMQEEDLEGVEGDKALSKDDCGGDAEEAVRLEWADKCLCIRFKCPCSKGYQILLSGNNCYYKLV